MIKNNEETKENRAELRSETTIKVKHYKESVRKFSPTVITSIEALNSYFKKDNFDDKSQKIQIFDIPSNETAERFEKYEAFPLELKDIELIFYSDFYKDPSDINSILKNILKKKSALEVFRLSIVDTHKNLDSIEFQLINSLKKLKTLKINLGLNVLGHKTQKIVLKALEGHPDLRALSLSLNNCDLKDDFLNSLTHRCFFELQLQSKLKKFKLNLSNNKFLFNSTIEVIWLRKLFASFNVIEVIDLNFSMNEHLNKIFDMVIQALKLVLFGLVTLREFKLNLFYCKLSHDNIENLCEILAKMNERLNIKLDLREDSDHEIQIKTIKVIEVGTMKKKINCFSEEEQKFCKKQRINYLAEENINKSSKNLLFEKVRQNEGILERLKGKLQNITINIQNNNLNSDISDSNLIQLSKPNDLLFFKKTETPFERRKKTENKIDNLFCIGNEKKIDVKAKNSLNIPQKTANKPEDFYEEIIKFEVTPEKQTEKPTFPQKETLRKHSKTNWASETIKKSNQYKENSSFHENNQKKKIIGKESIVSKSSKIIKDNLQKKPSNQLKKSSWEWQKDRRNHICKVLLEIDQKYTFLKKHIG